MFNMQRLVRTVLPKEALVDGSRDKELGSYKIKEMASSTHISHIGFGGMVFTDRKRRALHQN